MNPDQAENHYRRVRRRSRTVSWTLVPVFVVVIALWFLFNTIVCGSGRASAFELRLCSNAHLLPDVSGFLVLASLVWLFFALRSLGKELLEEQQIAGGRQVLRQLRQARHGYKSLSQKQQRDTVLFALEMSGWATALAICTLIFYRFELAFPLGLLAIAAVLTILYRLLVRLIKKTLPPMGTSSSSPVEPAPKSSSDAEEPRPPMELEDKVFHAEIVDIDMRRKKLAADRPKTISDSPTLAERSAFQNAYTAVEELKAAKQNLADLEQGPGVLSRFVQPVVDVVTTQTAKAISQAAKTIRWYRSAPPGATAEATTSPEETTKSPEEKRKEAELQRKSAEARTKEVARPSSKLGLTGLALSGGGIRSATFNLGVVQAFCKRGLFEHFDYLSTVSGGGYIGGMMSSLLRDNEIRPSAEDFPLRHERGKEESPEVKHLRSGASYLAPQGVLDKIRIPALFLRGLLVNLFLLLPYLIWAAVVTELIYGDALRDAYEKIVDLGAEVPLKAYYIPTYNPTFMLGSLLLVWVLLFPPFRNFVPLNWKRRNWLERAFAFCFLVTVVVAMLNTLPLIVLVFRAYDFSLNFVAGGGFTTILTLAAPLLPLLLASGTPRPLNTWQGKLMIWLLGLIGPLILLLIYIQLASWRVFCGAEIAPDCPRWWLFLVEQANELDWDKIHLRLQSLDLALATVGLLLFVYGWLAVDVNLTSLHGFYRDRLSRAYLFRWVRQSPQHQDSREPMPPMNDELRLSDLAPEGSRAPYHLVNATLNLQASRALQGRRADFFLFSKRFVGSSITGYLETPQLETLDRRLDLATAVAVSGAALAPNMGTSTNRALVFVMTLLNVRTGYWLPNPLAAKFKVHTLKGVGPVYLLFELLGLVDEKSPYVNVSDGGHVENLGLYELLRRRCRYIVVCDAEEDDKLTFDGLGKVMRYARIDGGVEIDLKLDRVRKDAQGLSRAHYAVGRIRYEPGSEGLLVYIKATLCGNETEDILSYRAHNSQPNRPAFPHEPTSQQFFNEGQFESYRALGYHIADTLLDEGDFREGMTLNEWIGKLEAQANPEQGSSEGTRQAILD